ncbi:MAG TPA: flavin reductase family protein [Hanamia sp.]|nr:flavin reductase family protein [Hanamia sp.]
MFKSFKLKDIDRREAQNFLKHAISPRPICFASTVNAKVEVNLSPFSYFNLFSGNPPVVIFSVLRRVRNNTTKHTLENVLEVPEVAINIVDFEMVQQVSISSCEYPKGTDEFIKSGFTKEPSELIKPPRVKESPFQMECKVLEVKSLGNEGGAGQLIICEVLMFHIDEKILNESGKIDQRKLHHVARLGGNWYAKIGPENLFEVEKPNTQLGIGFDNLPEGIRSSEILTGNQLAQLANVHELPQVDPAFEDERLKNIFQYFSTDPAEMERELHKYAALLLEEGKVNEAWQVLLALF